MSVMDSQKSLDRGGWVGLNSIRFWGDCFSFTRHLMWSATMMLLRKQLFVPGLRPTRPHVLYCRVRTRKDTSDDDRTTSSIPHRDHEIRRKDGAHKVTQLLHTDCSLVPHDAAADDGEDGGNTRQPQLPAQARVHLSMDRAHAQTCQRYDTTK